VDGGKEDTCTVTVGTTSVSVTGVTLNPKTLSLVVGGVTGMLTPTIAPNNATNTNVTWSTSAAGVATVSNGVVSPVGAGTATITVTTADGGKTANCTVTVSAPGDITLDIGFGQIADETLTLSTPGTISMGGTSNVTVSLTEAAQYTSVNWYVPGTSITASGASITLKPGDFTAAGEYFLTVKVIKDGVPYNKTVTFTVAN
jgi:uncharacterized protein YjdB